jgi:hypothetical protein
MESSQSIASDGVKHGAGQKAEADGYEEDVKHGDLVFSGAISALT